MICYLVLEQLVEVRGKYYSLAEYYSCKKLCIIVKLQQSITGLNRCVENNNRTSDIVRSRYRVWPHYHFNLALSY